MKRYSYNMQQPLPSVQTNSSNQTVAVGNTLLGFGAILLFSSLVLGAVLYKRHRTYRARVLCQEIEMLERIWRLPSQPLDR
jgi:hypothetical protein